MLIFEADGRYGLILSRRCAKVRPTSRTNGTADENKAVVQGTISHFMPSRAGDAEVLADCPRIFLCRSSVRGHRSEVMFGVLVIIFRPDQIAGLDLSLG
jgi:hypothetical protein